MPANLPPQYFHVQDGLKRASTVEEKIAIYEELLSIIPKHKGTEKLQKELKTKISTLKKEKQSGKKGPARFSFHIPKEGAGQVILMGPANTGKSTIFNELTGVESEIGDFPFTTREYKVGMMKWENVQVQIVDTPPILNEFMDRWLPSVIRVADLIICVLDPSSDDVLDQFDLVKDKLIERNITIYNHEEGKYKPNIAFIANKNDEESFSANLDVLMEFYGDLRLFKMNTSDNNLINELKRLIYDRLSVIRVYCKPQGKSPDMSSPVILKKGSNVLDLARDLGKVFVEKFRYAKLFNKGNMQGIMVAKDFQLNDGDIIELYTE